MEFLTSLYQQFDPARPLEADEEELYVDWQKELGQVNVKQILVHSIARSGDINVTRLFTGHRGVGKTTELKRVQQTLANRNGKRRLFVSFLQAEQWLDLQDVESPDIIFHIVRQLVSDLQLAGFTFDRIKFNQFFKEIEDHLRREVDLKDLKFKSDFVELGIVLKEVPVARSKLRMLLQTRLPTIFHLINNVVLKPAKEWLKRPANGGYDDVLLIVDELDRIPQKFLNDHGLTNHENIFLDHNGILRGLHCDVVYTIPIELAYSQCRPRLRDVYGGEILTLPVIPVTKQDGSHNPAGLHAVCEIVAKRAQKAGVKLENLFSDNTLLEHLARVSGGHVRNLFILLRSAIDYTETLPITPQIIGLTLRQESDSISLPLTPRAWELLGKVHKNKRALEEEGEIWHGLLRDLFVFGYRDAEGSYYDWNPLLGEVVRR